VIGGLCLLSPLESVAVMVCVPGVRKTTPVNACWARSVGWYG